MALLVNVFFSLRNTNGNNGNNANQTTGLPLFLTVKTYKLFCSSQYIDYFSINDKNLMIELIPDETLFGYEGFLVKCFKDIDFIFQVHMLKTLWKRASSLCARSYGNAHS